MKIFRMKVCCGIVMGLAFSSLAEAQDLRCAPNLIGEDICLLAESMETEMAAQLPLAAGEGVTVTSITADGSVLNVTGLWAMTAEEFLGQLLPSPLSLSEFRQEGHESTTRMACSAEPLAAYVGLGGEVRYVYYTNDGVRIFEALVVHCD